MTRIEIVTQLMAASIIRCRNGVEWVLQDDVEHAGRIADLIIYDDIYKRGEVEE